MATMNRSERRFNRKMFGHMVFKDVESARNFLIEKKVVAFTKGDERIEVATANVQEICDLLFTCYGARVILTVENKQIKKPDEKLVLEDSDGTTPA